MKAAEAFTIFDEVTRRPVSRITCDADQIDTYLTPGQRAVPGRHDWATKLDEDGDVITDQQQERNLARDRRRQASMARIEELERKQQRRVRELLAASDPTMMAYEEEIAQLRAIMGDETNEPTPQS
jgi:hypothetical protein